MSRTPSWTSTERRRHKRVSLVQEIECSGGPGSFGKRMTDISVGGMFVDGLTSFPSGSEIGMKFRLPGEDDPIEVRARVVYVQEKVGSGVQFLDLKQEDFRRIEEFVGRVSTRRSTATMDIRGAARVVVSIKIKLRGTAKDGLPFEEETTIVTLSQNGASVLTRSELEPGMTVFLDLPKGIQREARVVWAGAKEAGIQCRGLAHSLGFAFP